MSDPPASSHHPSGYNIISEIKHRIPREIEGQKIIRLTCRLVAGAVADCGLEVVAGSFVVVSSGGFSFGDACGVFGAGGGGWCSATALSSMCAPYVEACSMRSIESGVSDGGPGAPLDKAVLISL